MRERYGVIDVIGFGLGRELRFTSTSTISRPTPLMTRAYADAEPTIPVPTIPTFIAGSSV